MVPPLPSHLSDQTSRLHPNDVPLDSRSTGAGHWVEIRSLRHQVKPTARAIREGLSLIRQVLGVTAVEERGQVLLRSRPTCQPPHRPSDTR